MDYTTQMQNLIAMLWGLKRGVYVANYGLCSQLEAIQGAGLITYELRRRVKKMMQHWPEYTGYADYPVPGIAAYSMCPEATYDDTHMLLVGGDFSGEYGGNRIRLVNWLIIQLEAELAAYAE